MKITKYISYSIDRLPKGYIFTYDDFMSEVKNKEAIIKALNRMVESDKIRKLSKGKYYKPEVTAFGELPPDKKQVVKDLLEKDGKLIGYISGYGIYNQLGLTTQVSNSIQIGRNEYKSTIQRGIYKISFIRQKNTITKENIPLLQILDAVRDIKFIPDTSTSKAAAKLLSILKKLDQKERQTISKLALKYPPATRAITGALLEQLGEEKLVTALKKSLNPISIYGLYNISSEVLPNAKDWNIE